jgi:hypothetical protein
MTVEPRQIEASLEPIGIADQGTIPEPLKLATGTGRSHASRKRRARK